MECPNKLIPLMREGIEVIKMIIFQKLRGQLGQTHPERDGVYLSRLAGAVVNELFGTPNDQGPFATFVSENRHLIDAELRGLAQTLPEIRIPFTDALRMQFLCDPQEGQDNGALLNQALDLGLLLYDREIPLPHTFMELVRRLGTAFNLILPPMPPDISFGTPES
jgi:hypothetical protein